MPGERDRAAEVGLVRVSTVGDELRLGVRVTPSAPRSRLIGIHGDRLKVAVAAPPEDNRANSELERSLTEWTGTTRGRVRVVKGHSSRDKVVAFSGVEEEGLRESLSVALEKC